LFIIIENFFRVVCLEGRISFEKDGKNYQCKCEILQSPEAIKPLLNEKCWLVFRELSAGEKYPAEIAKKLGLGQQEVYYYINKLKSKGLLEMTRKEEKQGGLAKYYSTTKKCFAIVPNVERIDTTEILGAEKIVQKNLQEFFYPFIRDGQLDSKIVIGAPDSHGVFKARARDAHIAAELACFLGLFCNSIKQPFVFLDTMVKHISEENANLIVIGGPITNKTSAEVNDYLSIKFWQKNAHWVIKSTNSDKEYTEDSVGIVEKIKHPFFENRSILFLAGKRNVGTKAAVLALMLKTAEMAMPNSFNKRNFAHVVEGLDLDSDGQIDNVEILE
ncbi:MAG: S-layer protein, partial [Candidatus Pacearchaeota archaeon]